MSILINESYVNSETPLWAPYTDAGGGAGMPFFFAGNANAVTQQFLTVTDLVQNECTFTNGSNGTLLVRGEFGFTGLVETQFDAYLEEINIGYDTTARCNIDGTTIRGASVSISMSIPYTANDELALRQRSTVDSFGAQYVNATWSVIFFPSSS
jgi:hypothetical protein